MIRHPRHSGVVFSQAADGDQKDSANRVALSASLGIDEQWATVNQVHENNVVRVDDVGPAGEGDALWTTSLGVPIAVFTADCYGVVVGAPEAVGVAHAGWRGTRAAVVSALISAMTAGGHEPAWASLGPGIGPCCFEVGPDVADVFPDYQATTNWGTPSVDLADALRDQLANLTTWEASACTYSDKGWFSYRRDATRDRLVTLAWVP